MLHRLKNILRPIKLVSEGYLRYPQNPMLYANSRYSDPGFFDWYITYANQLEQFHNRHSGEDCFVIGNGPSLNKMDLSHLKDYHLFGLNKIYLLFDRVKLDLSYHVAVNPLVIEQSYQHFAQLGCPSFLSYTATPENAKKVLAKNIFLILTGSPFSFQGNLKKRLCEGHTVTYVALQLAFYMGFKRVFLIGVDHNFKVQGTPNEKQYLNGADQNHFAPNYFGNQNWHLPDLEASELAYHLARFHFQRDGREIYDATVNGKLTVFPKISYQQALEQCSIKN